MRDESAASLGLLDRFDPILMAVIANRFEAICREMTFTLQRAGRSAILSMGRDFSCAIVTRDSELLVGAESLPIHILGLDLQAKSMHRLVSNIQRGDAFLHNDPYDGNSHHADHTVLVPVFVDGSHVFTACVKAHQADAGNSIPTTYAPGVRDIYAEGALNFPCVRVQRDFEDVEDVIRMCRRRIRVPDQWYGDYLAMIGAARVGERRIQEVVEKYGLTVVDDFVAAWFEYGEECMKAAIQKLPRRHLVGIGRLDPYPNLPDGLEIRAEIDIDPDEGLVTLDLRDNPNCVQAGVNLSEATSTSAVAIGFLNSIDAEIPNNAGTFRRIDIKVRENCVVGIPVHPTSCSMATTHVADRLVNLTQAALAQLGPEFGAAEGGLGMPASIAVISGSDWRTGGARYINQLMLGNAGGPGTPQADGWVNYCMPVAAGLTYRDSVEVAEKKYPFHIFEQRLVQDSEGAGRRRGSPGSRVVFGPKRDDMTVIQAIDGMVNPPAGVAGGEAGGAASSWVERRDGRTDTVVPVGTIVLREGERIGAISCGGGGFGPPWLREPERVLGDVNEGWVSERRARDSYFVVVIPNGSGGFRLDRAATEELRAGQPAWRS